MTDHCEEPVTREQAARMVAFCRKLAVEIEPEERARQLRNALVVHPEDQELRELLRWSHGLYANAMALINCVATGLTPIDEAATEFAAFHGHYRRFEEKAAATLSRKRSA